MAAMVQVQTYQQQAPTITMLQSRPSSSAGATSGQSLAQGQAQHSQFYRTNANNPHRNSIHGLPQLSQSSSYRGNSFGPTFQPYAFASTPTPSVIGNGVSSHGQWHPYGTLRTNSSPSVSTFASATDSNSAQRVRHQASAPLMNTSVDDSSLLAPSANKQQTTYAQVAAIKTTPERYRRTASRNPDSSGGSKTVSQAQPQGKSPAQAKVQGLTPGQPTIIQVPNPRAAGEGFGAFTRSSASGAARPHSIYGYVSGTSADDLHLQRQPTSDEARRNRRRSIHSMELANYPTPLTPQELRQQQAALAASSKRGSKANAATMNGLSPTEKTLSPGHGRSLSSESVTSRNSSRSGSSRPSSSTTRNYNSPTPTTTSPASTTTSSDDRTNANSNANANVPSRASSVEANKRMLNPSPLSKPVIMTTTPPTIDESASSSSPQKNNSSKNNNNASTDKDGAGPHARPTTPSAPSANATGSESPAAKRLAAINEKGGKGKSKTSKLRRAFSFGSAAELRKAGVTGSTIKEDLPSDIQKDQKAEDAYEEEQERIAKKQEASGLGSSIYSGTKIFSGSTDNLSVSSTASSASIMLRKMGKGMKKGGRSLVGLFRPKSIVGSPTSESAAPAQGTQATEASVTMITVEAERERVNVNSNEDLDQPSGPTGFPHLERNSMDAMDAGLDLSSIDAQSAERADSMATDSSAARKSIAGGEKERAEVLSTIRKGILKTRSNSPSPQPKARDAAKGAASFELPPIPTVSDSPHSSAPSTPNEDSQPHKHADALAIGNEDYFVSALRLRQDSKTGPGMPHGSLGKRNATFSPRIVFHDTWPSQEYDRRGDIATCNRLTPMLAQQIKEELNSFKMEMEVHETSKIYTHFF